MVRSRSPVRSTINPVPPGETGGLGAVVAELHTPGLLRTHVGRWSAPSSLNRQVSVQGPALRCATSRRTHSSHLVSLRDRWGFWPRRSTSTTSEAFSCPGWSHVPGWVTPAGSITIAWSGCVLKSQNSGSHLCRSAVFFCRLLSSETVGCDFLRPCQKAQKRTYRMFVWGVRSLATAKPPGSRRIS